MTTTKPLLTFAIPTWNRQSEVEVCIRSIAEQIKTQVRHITILVSDDCSTDETAEVVKRLQQEYSTVQIDYRCREKRTDYSDAFRDIFAIPDAEWVWTFGDDDYLEPGALNSILKVFEHAPELQFIHVSEKTRYAGTHGLYKGDLLALCNQFGWIEMTGFITGNICRGEYLRRATQSLHWRCYAQTAFVQSCALLEVLKDEPCALMDEPLVSLQHTEQSEQTKERWMADNISTRYLYIAGAIERMYDEGILTAPVKPAFFRYLAIYMWDRYLWYFIEDYLNQNGVWLDSAWSNVQKMATFIDDEEMAAGIIKDVEAARGLTTLHNYMKANQAALESEMKAIQARHSERSFPDGYVIPREMN